MEQEELLTLLGTKTHYVQTYSPDLLEKFPRTIKREAIGIHPGSLPFRGYDLWTAWEISWINGKGKPVVAIGEFTIPATTPELIESKSFKLYLNSFNQSSFQTVEEVSRIMENDLSQAAGQQIKVTLYPGLQGYDPEIGQPDGICLDEMDIAIDQYNFDSSLLEAAVTQDQEKTCEALYSNLLKSNCPVTNQPDWGTIFIRYQGCKIDHEKLLRYLISFRTRNEFHEQCVERVYCNIMRYCRPDKLTVFARYTRRGGLDINPFRSNYEDTIPLKRLIRQ